jgi:AhpD family alkylhydroperoxidase
MNARLDFAAVSPALTAAYFQFSLAARGAAIEQSLRHLVDIRVSQLNGCAFCVDMHVKEAKIAGERELRLYHLAVWRESLLFTPRERAALAWAEMLTRLPPGGIEDETYRAVSGEFSAEELVSLTFIVVAINGWNRTSVAFRPAPGSMDERYGLTGAGLS